MAAGKPGPKSKTQQEKAEAYKSIVGPIRATLKREQRVVGMCHPGTCVRCAKVRLARRILKLVDGGVTKLV